MEDLKEVITSSQFSSRECNILFYSTSRGAVKMIDTRAMSMCDLSPLVLEEPEDGNNKNFFTEITNSISDFK
jgi:serine/threonine-protein phosphatase 2A regulatory subunit B